MGKAHVVPAQLAEVSDRRKTIRLPLTEADVKNAPAFDCGADIDHTAEDQIGSYYQKHGYKKDVPATPAPAAAKGVESKEEARVQLKEGKLKVGKREVEYGGVRLRKVVRTEEVNKPVELKREEIVVERGSRNRPSDEIERCRFYRRRNLFPASPRRGGRRETILCAGGSSHWQKEHAGN